jgi:hypothetical protein
MRGSNDTELCGILLRNGWVHKEQIDEAFELQKLKGKSIREILLDLGYVDEENVLSALGEQFDLPVEHSLEGKVEAALTTRVPISFIREYHMVPYKQNGTGFLVAINDPVNLLPLDDLRLLLGGPVRRCSAARQTSRRSSTATSSSRAKTPPT